MTPMEGIIINENLLVNKILQEAELVASKPIWIKSLVLAPKSFNYAYIKYRILRPLLKGYYKFFNLFHPQSPWTTPASILFFNKVLTKEMTGLEYGSGRSTVFFAKRLRKLVSIEHHTKWYEKVKLLLAKKELDNVEYLLIPEQHQHDVVDKDFDLETELKKMDGSEPRHEFYNYYAKVNDYTDDFFDFVLIDGRARVKCGLNAMKKLKKGGIFVLDNSERPRYKPLHTALTAWPKVETTTGLTNTTIWVKP
jgi:hypothetical protein